MRQNAERFCLSLRCLNFRQVDQCPLWRTLRGRSISTYVGDQAFWQLVYTEGGEPWGRQQPHREAHLIVTRATEVLAFRTGDIKFSLAGSEPGWRQTQQRDTSCLILVSAPEAYSLEIADLVANVRCLKSISYFSFSAESFWMPVSQRLSSYSSRVHSIDELSVSKNLNVLQEQYSSGHLTSLKCFTSMQLSNVCMHVCFHPAVHQILSKVNWVDSPLLVSWY